MSVLRSTPNALKYKCPNNCYVGFRHVQVRELQLLGNSALAFLVDMKLPPDRPKLLGDPQIGFHAAPLTGRNHHVLFFFLFSFLFYKCKTLHNIIL